jgi:hypothetical protein
VVRHDALLNKLRELGYRYKTQKLRTELYKRPGNPNYAVLPRKELLDEANVKEVLAFTGMTAQQIKTFIDEHRCVPLDTSPKKKGND